MSTARPGRTPASTRARCAPWRGTLRSCTSSPPVRSTDPARCGASRPRSRGRRSATRTARASRLWPGTRRKGSTSSPPRTTTAIRSSGSGTSAPPPPTRSLSSAATPAASSPSHGARRIPASPSPAARTTRPSSGTSMRTAPSSRSMKAAASRPRPPATATSPATAALALAGWPTPWVARLLLSAAVAAPARRRTTCLAARAACPGALPAVATRSSSHRPRGACSPLARLTGKCRSSPLTALREALVQQSARSRLPTRPPCAPHRGRSARPGPHLASVATSSALDRRPLASKGSTTLPRARALARSV
mmetsp:Transcript_1592/g.4957  ORF Transcript_1592/g.4957 Transcript_1592/m.4957 type:complete len:307 (-) Transcript_1592:379-1299(-)